jgi:hypothetical protein
MRVMSEEENSNCEVREETLEELKERHKQLVIKETAEPTRRRYKTNDATVEKLGEMLRDNPNGLLGLHDELVGLLASWDKLGREGDKAFYLQAWSGDASYDTDRIGRGSIHIPNLCISVFGGIQPDKLQGYLDQAANSLGNDGMLQRFQVLVYPDPMPWAYHDTAPNQAAEIRANAVFDKLAELAPLQCGALVDVKLPSFRFDADGQAIFVEWMTDLHRNIASERNPFIVQHLAKYASLFPALALIFHLIDVVDGVAPGPVTEQAALRAAAWCEYLEPHARRCYGLEADGGLRSAQALATMLQETVEADGAFAPLLSDGFTARDVRRKRRRYLVKEEAVTAALDWLEDKGWIRPMKDSQSSVGRPTVRYEINPAVRRVSHVEVG